MKGIKLRGILFILVIVLGMAWFFPSSVQSGSLMDYFTFSYSVQFSKTAVDSGETFFLTATGEVTCKQDLAFPYNLADEAEITMQVAAQNTSDGTEAILNSSYTVSITPFPKLAGERAQDTQTVSLLFPSDSQVGVYTVTGKLLSARVRASTLWVDVTANLPQSQVLGTIQYGMPPPPDKVSLALAIKGQGSLTPAAGQNSYLKGTTVQIMAQAAQGWLFAGWDGDLEGPDNPASLVLNRDKSVTAVFVSTGPLEYRVPLAAGWNYISLPLIPQNGSIETVLHSISGEYTEIWSYEPQTQIWKTWIPGAPEELYEMVPKLQSLTAGTGYLLRMKQASVLNGSGLQVQAGPAVQPLYPVYPGWNLIGFKTMDFNHDGRINSSTDLISAGCYLQTLDVNRNQIILEDEVNYFRYCDSTGGWHEADHNENLIAGQGYWLHWRLSNSAAIQPPLY